MKYSRLTFRSLGIPIATMLTIVYSYTSRCCRNIPYRYNRHFCQKYNIRTRFYRYKNTNLFCLFNKEFYLLYYIYRMIFKK